MSDRPPPWPPARNDEHAFDLADGWCHTHRRHCSMAAETPEPDPTANEPEEATQ